MRVLILSHFYHPEPIPKPSDLAQELQRRGHTVSVITGFPNYPTGRLYPGYRLRLLRRDTVEGVPVLRTAVWPSHSTSRLGRVANYMSAMLSAIAGGIVAPPADVIYVFHPPLTIGVAAWVVARLKRARVVLDVQDIWPESIVQVGMVSNRTLIAALHWLERFVYRRVARLLVITENARANLIAKGVPPEKILVMPHWANETLFAQAPAEERVRLRSELGLGNRFAVMFAGNMGLLQGLDTILDAARLLKDEAAVFVLVGDGTDRVRLMARASRMALHNVLFVDRQPLAAMPGYFACADALLVHLKREGISEFVIPTKAVAYLAAGRPILMAMDGPAAELVEASGAGIAVSPEDPVALASAVRKLMAHPPNALAALGEAARAYARRHFLKSRVIDRYEQVLRSVATSDA